MERSSRRWPVMSGRCSECKGDMGIAVRSGRWSRPSRAATVKVAAAMMTLGVLLAGCFSETYRKGYILPDGALEQIPIGSTQEQLFLVLATPSTAATLRGDT